MLLLSTGWDLSPGVVFPFLALATAIGANYAKGVRDKALADAERAQLTKQVDILWAAMISRSVQDLHHCSQFRMDGLLEAFEAKRATPSLTVTSRPAILYVPSVEPAADMASVTITIRFGAASKTSRTI